MFTDWLQQLVYSVTQLAPAGTFFSLGFNVRAFLALILVSLICGAVGSLVVGNRMAFFSDALVHCAFAGVALGVLTGVLTNQVKDGPFFDLGVPFIMVAFGAVTGLGIAFVRERTSLASDTVIGVFFAGAIGFGAVLFRALTQMGYFNLEGFLFGDLNVATPANLLVLLLLVLVTLGLLTFLYNPLVFASFNPSLARSRNIPLRLGNYLFIILLAMIVNLCQKIVGAMLINALLIVPAATAANLCRNVRQLVWATTILCLLVGIGGQQLSWHISTATDLEVGTTGLIVVLSVVLFFVSMALRPKLQGSQVK